MLFPQLLFALYFVVATASPATTTTSPPRCVLSACRQNGLAHKSRPGMGDPDKDCCGGEGNRGCNLGYKFSLMTSADWAKVGGRPTGFADTCDKNNGGNTCCTKDDSLVLIIDRLRKDNVINLREVYALDGSGKYIKPTKATMSSNRPYSGDEPSRGAANCVELSNGGEDKTICHSSEDDKHPSLVLVFASDADIHEIEVVNRNEDGESFDEYNARIVGASIRLTRGGKEIFKASFDASKKVYTWTLPDPACVSGILLEHDNVTVCCLRSCGKCGGTNCHTRPGEGGCCHGSIVNAGRSCALYSPPCVVPPTTPTTTAATTRTAKILETSSTVPPTTPTTTAATTRTAKILEASSTVPPTTTTTTAATTITAKTLETSSTVLIGAFGSTIISMLIIITMIVTCICLNKKKLERHGEPEDTSSTMQTVQTRPGQLKDLDQILISTLTTMDSMPDSPSIPFIDLVASPVCALLEAGIPWARAQLLVVGDQGVGKTSLSRALRNVQNPFLPCALGDQAFEDTSDASGIDIRYLETTGIRRCGEIGGAQYEAVDELATRLFRAEAELQRVFETETEHEGDLGQALKNALQVGLEPGISPVVKRVQQHLRQASANDEVPAAPRPQIDGAPSPAALVPGKSAQDPQLMLATASTASGTLDSPHTPASPQEHHAAKSTQLKAAQRRFKEAKAEASGDAASDAIIAVWDFAGKPVVSAMEHVLMNPLAIYAVVFNIANLLNENTQQRALRCLVERLYNIAFQASEPRVLLVGSHKDKLRDLENDLRKAQAIVGKRLTSILDVAKIKLLKHLSKPSDSEWFFAVDSKSCERNASGDTQYRDPTLNNIRAELKKIVLADDREVPGLDGQKISDLNADRRLVVLAGALKSCASEPSGGSRRSVCSVERVLQLAEDIGLDTSSAESVTRILTSISALGAARWFPDIAKDVVVLDPQWMIDPMDILFAEGHRSGLLIKLSLSLRAASKFNQAHVRDSLYKDELLTHMWSSNQSKYGELNRSPEEIEALKNILQRFSVICPVDAVHKLYAVPALLSEEGSSNAVSEHIEPLLQQSKYAERRICRWDFSKSEWLPRHLCDQLMCAIVSKHEHVMLRRDVACIRAPDGVLLLKIDTEHWCIEAQTVNDNAVYPHASNWMIKLVNRELDFIMSGLPAQVKPEVFLHTSDGDVKLYDLVNNGDQPVFTSTKKVIKDARTLKAKWLRSARNSHKPAHALVIGINDYKNLAPLKNAVNDARAIKEALEKEGVIVFYAENCTIAQLNEIVQLYLGSLQEGEVTLVFFAGHGVEFANANRLLAISESDVTDYKRDSLNLLLLLLRIKKKGVRISVAMLDCCREFVYSQNRSAKAPSALDTSQMKGSSGTISVFACSENAKASDKSGDGHGLFTKHVLKNLTLPNLEVHAMFRRVGKAVFEESNGKQEPRIDSSIYDDQVVLFK